MRFALDLCAPFFAGALLLGIAGTQSSALATEVMKEFCDRDSNPPGFSTATAIAKPAPSYPPGDLIRESEGWALLSYTIAADGSTRDIAVVDRMGSQNILKASMEALSAWRYAPAMFNGRAVAEYGNTLDITYRSNADAHGVVHDLFIERYNYGRALIKNKKPREAVDASEAAITRPLTLHEQTMLSYLLALAYSNLGDVPRALQHIRHATIDGRKYLDPKVLRGASRLQLMLEAKDGNFHYVVCWSPEVSLQADADDPQSDVEAARTVTAVRAALTNPAPLALAATLATNPWVGGAAQWEHRLLRRKFAFDSISGGVKNLRLVCQTEVIESPVNETSQWAVPESAGRCSLHVYGEPGATFRLIEEW